MGQLPAEELIYQQVAQSLRDVGVRVELRGVTYAQWLQKYASAEWGDTDAFGYVWDSGGNYDAAPHRTHFLQEETSIFCDPTIMPLLTDVACDVDAAHRLPRLRELNRARRDRVPVIWILNVVDSYGVNRRVRGLEICHMGLLYENLSVGLRRVIRQYEFYGDAPYGLRPFRRLNTWPECNTWPDFALERAAAFAQRTNLLAKSTKTLETNIIRMATWQ